MEHLTLDNAILILPWVISAITLLLKFLQARKAGKTLAEAVLVTVNALKVEDKLMPDGTFKKEMVEKVAQVAQTLEVGKEAKAAVKEVISSGSHADIKLGSIKGKPVYLGQVAGILGIGGSIAAKVRNIWKKIKP